MAQQKIDAIASREKFFLTRKKDVVKTLKLLKNEKTIISASFGSGKYSVPTIVLDILPERSLLILDYGPNEAINKKFLVAERVSFVTSYHGIQVQFSAQEVTKAKFNGLPVYTVPIPDALLWLQRRQSYRIKMPMENPVRCQVLVNHEESIEVNVLDISATGIAFMDEKCHFSEDADEGNKVINCKLLLPEIGEMSVSMEIRSRLLLKKDNVSGGQRVGCQFMKLTYTNESSIQRYIQNVERKRRQLSKT